MIDIQKNYWDILKLKQEAPDPIEIPVLNGKV